MLGTARFLFWLGVIVMVFEVVGNFINIVHLISVHAFTLNESAWTSMFLGSFYQGGTLIGLGKILESLNSKR